MSAPTGKRSDARQAGERESLFPFFRRMVARWIATPFWNARFSFGMWIGGFDHARRDYPQRKETA